MHSMYILFYVILIGTVHAILKWEDSTTNATLKNERQFPNGSVIGKYRYKDESGNTVFVRYYADDSSYGVELKSVRAIDDTRNSAQINKQDNSKLENTPPSTNSFEPAVAVNATKYLTADDFYKNDSSNAYDVLNTYAKKNDKGHHKTNNDYEIFLENVLKPSERHKKERVRIYVDKYKRNGRKNTNGFKKPV